MNYERINWEDGTQVEGAYVEIGGTRYPVVMPTYDCDTPVTASNLNVMDDGIFTAKNIINYLNSDLRTLEREMLDLTEYYTLTLTNSIYTPNDMTGTLYYTRIGNLVHIYGDLVAPNGIPYSSTAGYQWLVGLTPYDFPETLKPKRTEFFPSMRGKNNQFVKTRLTVDSAEISVFVYANASVLDDNEHIYINAVYAAKEE